MSDNALSSLASFGMMPDQAKKEYTDEDYIKTLRFCASRWNIANTSFTLMGQYWQGQGSPNVGNNLGPISPSVEMSKGFARRYMEDLAYFYGSQVQTDYGFFNKDELGNTTRVPMFRGMDMTKYTNHVVGVFNDMIKFLPKMINVTAYSLDAVSAKKTMLDMIKLRADHNETFKQIELITGVGLKPADLNWDDDLQIKKHLQNFQESMEKAYQALAKHITILNDYQHLFHEGGLDVAIGGMGMVEVYHHNGKVKWKRIPPERAIFDSTKSNDQHDRSDSYGGEVFEMTIPELLNSYEWTETEIEDLKSIAQNINTWGVYNTFIGINGLYWWSQNDGVPKVTCVRGQWRSAEWKDGEWVEVLREGVLIGNKYLRKQGISAGQVWDKHDHSKRKLRYRVVTPNSRNGAVIGIIGLTKRFQDLKDAITTKMTAMVSQAIGKSYIIRAAKLPEGLRTPDIISQLKQSGFVVIEGADIDELPQDRQERLIEPVDMTLDPNIQLLLGQIQYWDNAIADILNIPATARGQLSTYQSKDVVASSLTQSTMGMDWFYRNMMLWVKGILEYSADLAKLILPETEEGKDYLSLVVGDAAVEIFEMDVIKRMQFEDMLLDINPNDIVAEQDKQWYKDLAVQLAGQGGFSMKDAVKMRRLQTVDELADYFEMEEMKRQQREEQMALAQMQNAQANTAMTIQGQENIAKTQADAKLEAEAMKQIANNQQQ